jgi:hypothetical protein
VAGVRRPHHRYRPGVWGQPGKISGRGCKRFDDVGGIELLAQCCEAADLVQELAECIEREGKTLQTKTGLRAHPALRDMLSARAFVVTTLRRLGIVDERVARVGRPSGPHWRGPNVY